MLLSVLNIKSLQVSKLKNSRNIQEFGIRFDVARQYKFHVPFLPSFILFDDFFCQRELLCLKQILKY